MNGFLSIFASLNSQTRLFIRSRYQPQFQGDSGSPTPQSRDRILESGTQRGKERPDLATEKHTPTYYAPCFFFCFFWGRSNLHIYIYILTSWVDWPNQTNCLFDTQLVFPSPQAQELLTGGVRERGTATRPSRRHAGPSWHRPA